MRWIMLHGATTAPYLMQTLMAEHALRGKGIDYDSWLNQVKHLKSESNQNQIRNQVVKEGGKCLADIV